MKLKVLTNIRFPKLAGIAQVVLQIAQHFSQTPNLNIEMAGVNVARAHTKLGAFSKKKYKGITIFHAKGKFANLVTAVKKAQSVSDIKDEYQGVTNCYLEAIDKFQPDVVWINGAYELPWGLFQAGRLRGLPIVMHFHGVLTEETSHYCLRDRKIFKQIEREFDDPSVWYVFPSQLAKRVIEEKVFEHKIKRATVLPNPIPEKYFTALLKKDRQKVGFVGRWSRLKNHNDFLQKFVKYNKQSKNKLDLHIITDKIGQAKLALGKTAKISQPRSREALRNFYEKLGVLISPSRFETYGNVSQEALACGVPAVVSRDMGVVETFKKINLSEWVIDFNSPVKVHEFLNKIIGKEVPLAARKFLKDNLSINNYSQSLASIFNKVYQKKSD